MADSVSPLGDPFQLLRWTLIAIVCSRRKHGAHAIMFPQWTSHDEVAHHLEIAVRILGVDASSIDFGLKLLDDMVGVRKHYESDRLPILNVQPPQATQGLGARCLTIVFSEHPQLRSCSGCAARASGRSQQACPREGPILPRALLPPAFRVEKRDVTMHVLEPRLLAVCRTDGCKLFVVAAEIAVYDLRSRIGNLHCLGHHLRAITVACHVQRDGFAIFFEC